ncbi:hypothetical protein CHS0354_028148 [Potamilus streckersoni]|uniref:Uncharacterized protein n=1 Tax=Potamilus streckersoni TaxID=2493646 RepID=A0AAE0TIC0_9BIVA|nr:hypothetical protein CHS0354_028148 [Potamilus streckersoni]
MMKAFNYKRQSLNLRDRPSGTKTFNPAITAFTLTATEIPGAEGEITSTTNTATDVTGGVRLGH